jgi:hypothetical protein
MGLVLSLALFVASALLLVLMALPYITLWQLDQAVRSADSSTLADLVDLDAVRSEIKKKLNKDEASAIGELSDPFIQWLQEGIQTMGGGAVERLVTLSWVRAQLLDHTAGDGGEGFVRQVSYAFFHASGGFAVRIGSAGDRPTHLFLKRSGLNWRVSAVYY